MADYHSYRPRNTSSWQSFKFALIVAAIGLPVLTLLIYLNITKPDDIAQNVPENPSKQEVMPTEDSPAKATEEKPGRAATPPQNPTSVTPKPVAPPPISKKPSPPPPSPATPQEKGKRGKQLCFLKGNWTEGLPMLAASDDEELKGLAQKELASPKGKAERLALADKWWTVSEHYAAPADKEIRNHAAEWYKKVLDELDESDHDRAEWRIDLASPKRSSGEKTPVNPDMLE